MAAQPNWDPVDEEIARVLAENSGLLEELQEMDRAYERGELELITDDEVRRRLLSLDVDVGPAVSEPEPEPDPPAR